MHGFKRTLIFVKLWFVAKSNFLKFLLVNSLVHLDNWIYIKLLRFFLIGRLWFRFFQRSLRLAHRLILIIFFNYDIILLEILFTFINFICLLLWHNCFCRLDIRFSLNFIFFSNIHYRVEMILSHYILMEILIFNFCLNLFFPLLFFLSIFKLLGSVDSTTLYNHSLLLCVLLGFERILLCL